VRLGGIKSDWVGCDFGRDVSQTERDLSQTGQDVSDWVGSHSLSCRGKRGGLAFLSHFTIV
jgi:hypothetical protein